MSASEAPVTILMVVSSLSISFISETASRRAVFNLETPAMIRDEIRFAAVNLEVRLEKIPSVFCASVFNSSCACVC